MAIARPIKTEFDALAFQPRFEHGDQAQAAVITGADDLGQLGTGFGRLTKARFAWTIQYSEVLLVLEGQLTVHADGQSFVLSRFDTLALPAGTSLEYEAQDALIYYAIHPANWGQIDAN